MSYEDDFADDFLHLNLPTTPGSSSFAVSVGPVVFFSVLDHYIRRSESQSRVVGALLGVRNCFPLSHTESDDTVAVDPDYLQQMYSLHQRVNSKEIIVGWYSTGTTIEEKDVHVHEFFANETYPFQPVHVLIDATLSQKKMSIKSYVSAQAGVPSADFSGSMFVQIPCELKFVDAERSGLDIISLSKDQDAGSSLLSDMDNLERSILLIQEMLETIATYVSEVQAGKIEANNAIGRFLMDTISSIPRIDPSAFEKMFNSHLQVLYAILTWFAMVMAIDIWAIVKGGEVAIVAATCFGILGALSSLVQFLPQILKTIEMKSSGALSVSMLAMQAPGNFVFVYSIYLQPGTDWTSWISFFVNGILQGILLSLCIYYKYEKRFAGDATSTTATETEEEIERRPLLQSTQSEVLIEDDGR
ncbi:Eukaryotic translation initiation factor 3 subunit F [Blyttiomyces sp. JEL0837]|nr:Eukaryotic translation initiation factor 3 subunit F [Blyttiomyces sp. JEL0837]